MGPRRIRGVAFDLEGTIIDVEAAHHKAHLASAADSGLHLELDEALKIIPHFIGGPDEAVASEISALSGHRISPQQVLERKKAYYKGLVSTMTVTPRSGFLAVCSWLKNHNYPVSVGSITGRLEADSLMERAGLKTVFDPEMVIVREAVALPKPAPDVYIETARHMNILPDEQLVFDDSPNGIIAACRAGSLAIGTPCIQGQNISARLFHAGALDVLYSWNEVDMARLFETVSTLHTSGGPLCQSNS